MSVLYPFKFEPLFKERIWGGRKLKSYFGKDLPENTRIGESWEVSAVSGSVSVVSNGFLKGNNLNELTEIYMDELLGGNVYERFGTEFPLLVKFIDASDILSLQVHPGDDLALERHGTMGKTEMWYVIQADKDASLVSGFSRDVTREEFLERLNGKTLPQILNIEKVAPGDVFYIPAGRIHAIGKGVLLAEIQQSSDITYRVYDWDRLDDKGESRELHVDLSLDAIDFKKYENYKTIYEKRRNELSLLANSRYFTTGVLDFDRKTERDYSEIDSFVIYICLEGEFEIRYGDHTCRVRKGETVLIPADTVRLLLYTKSRAVLLETYIKQDDRQNAGAIGKTV